MDHLPELILALMALAIFIAVAWYISARFARRKRDKIPERANCSRDSDRCTAPASFQLKEFRAIKLTFASTFAESSSSSDSDKDTEQARRRRAFESCCILNAGKTLLNVK